MREDARERGETITGIEGWLKKEGGGFARQVGIDVSPGAERLAAALESLKALTAPGVMGETRLSNEERTRLDNIMGSVSPGMDAIKLRGALAEALSLLENAVGGR